MEQFDYTFDNLTVQVQGLLDHLAVTDAIYCMQDYGGPIGLRLASSHPERLNPDACVLDQALIGHFALEEDALRVAELITQTF